MRDNTCTKCGLEIKGLGSLQSKLINGKLVHIECPKPANESLREQVALEPRDSPMGKFQEERTAAISEMFDNVDEYGIYPTGKFFARLDNCVRELLESQIPLVRADVQREIGELIELIGDLTDADKCQFDHDGNCQVHDYSSPCPMAQAQEIYYNHKLKANHCLYAVRKERKT